MEGNERSDREEKDELIRPVREKPGDQSRDHLAALRAVEMTDAWIRVRSSEIPAARANLGFDGAVGQRDRALVWIKVAPRFDRVRSAPHLWTTRPCVK